MFSYALCVGGKNQKRLAGLSYSHTILGSAVKQRLVDFFEFVIPGEDGFVFDLAGTGRHGIFHCDRNPMSLALFVLELQSSFPKHYMVDQILVHGISPQGCNRQTAGL